ncbi:hypothetical protein DL771_006013 [Monosporascus sp. 5C6A]|nr:hypothetical protein DL771_006013 [Monosporascus sp. 5C6A]
MLRCRCPLGDGGVKVPISRHGHRLKFLINLLLSFIAIVSAHGTTQCDSLITYRQYSILTSAPQCLRDGCGVPPPADSMSSWQPDWCVPVSALCARDAACRIPGWPILNATEVCSVSLDEWLFSLTAGCCAMGDEPFALADWIGSLCSSRTWNAGLLLEPSDYPPGSDLIVSFIADNLITVGQNMASIAIIWLLLYHKPLKWLVRRTVHPWHRALFAGLKASAVCVAGNFFTAIKWRRTPGYADVPIGYTGLLFCTRPSPLGTICFLDIVLRETLAGKMLPQGAAAPPSVEVAAANLKRPPNLNPAPNLNKPSSSSPIGL